MKRKMKITFASIVAMMFLTLSSVFATNGLESAADGVRNVVGGAENVIEDAGKSAAGAIKSGLNTAGEATQNVMDNMKNAGDNMADRSSSGTTGYTATRTATQDSSFIGMNANMWTWFIVGITGIAIIALVWYYASQNSYSEEE